MKKEIKAKKALLSIYKIAIFAVSENNYESFMEAYSKMINLFTIEFANVFCMKSGEIDWRKLIEYNSGK